MLPRTNRVAAESVIASVPTAGIAAMVRYLAIACLLTLAGLLPGAAALRLGATNGRPHHDRLQVHPRSSDLCARCPFSAAPGESLAKERHRPPEKIPALSSPPLPPEMPANRAHLCAWLS